MEELFLFVAIRPPDQISEKAQAPLKDDTRFLKNLEEAAAGDAPMKAVRDASDRFINEDADYIVNRLSRLTHLQVQSATKIDTSFSSKAFIMGIKLFGWVNIRRR